MMEALREVLDPWLGHPRWRQTEGRVTLVYRFQSEDAPPFPLRLKVEINWREHFTVYRLTRAPFALAWRWFEGRCEITTYTLDELLATKLRAFYQRSKGRDLFDLAIALERARIDPDRTLTAFSEYMARGGHTVTRAQFEENIEVKLRDPRFKAGIGPLLAAGFSWDSKRAARRLRSRLIARLPGEPWRGDEPR